MAKQARSYKWVCCKVCGASIIAEKPCDVCQINREIRARQEAERLIVLRPANYREKCRLRAQHRRANPAAAKRARCLARAEAWERIVREISPTRIDITA